MEVLGSFNFAEAPTLIDAPITSPVVQFAYGNIAAGSGTATVPLDTTAPLSTEGWPIFTTTFTPLLATSKLLIAFSITAAVGSGNSSLILSVFAGTVNIGACAVRGVTASAPYVMPVSIVYVPGSIAAITLSARLGANSVNSL